MIRFARILGFSTLLAVPSFGLRPSHHITQYGHASWSAQDGQLPGGVSAITQTSDGSLWVGTDFGLYRFDGVRFSPWKPPTGAATLPERISALAAAPDGGLWIGTRNGLWYWKGEQLRRLETPERQVSSLLVDRAGTVWVGTVNFRSGGLCRVLAGRVQCFTAADGYGGGGVSALAQDKAGEVWIGAVHGLYEWNSKGFLHYGADTVILAVAVDKIGRTIAATSDRLEQLVQGELVDYRTQEPMGGQYTPTLLADRDGGLWIGTRAAGLYHEYQGRADDFSKADGLSGGLVSSLFEDREGNVWAGTIRGLDRFRDLPVSIVSQREGLPSDAVGTVFASKEGGVWLGGAGVPSRVSASGEVLPDDSGLRSALPAGNSDSLFEERSGTLWVDSSRGLASISQGKVQWLELRRDPAESILAAAEDQDGTLWFSDAVQGLLRVERHRIAKVFPWSQFGNKHVSALETYPAGGGVLLGFSEGGVAEFTGERVSRWYGQGDGLGAGAITDLHFDPDGTAWIATQGGLSRLRNGRISTMGAGNGLSLSCGQIHAMVEAEDRNLWMNTSCGLVRIARKELDEWSADPQVKVHPKVFGAREGMHVRVLPTGYSRGAARSKDGQLWFPTADGVAVVDPRHLPYNSTTPPVEIESIVVDRSRRTVGGGLRLPHIAQGLEIDYTAFSFVDPDEVQFKYKLEGYDRDWVDAGGRRQAFYPSLAPGEYRFRVMAANNDGVWNEAGAELGFSVAPTVYQTLWFRGLLAGLFAGLVWLVYRLRKKQLEVRLTLAYEAGMRERTRISRELHDSLLQNVAALAMELDALSKVVTAPMTAKDHLRELRREAETWLREAREMVAGLRAKLAEGDLSEAIQRMGEKLTAGKSVRFQVRTSGVRRVLVSQSREHLLKIFEEAARNAVSHARASEIGVLVAYEDRGGLRLDICDDGCGFDLAAAREKRGRYGLTTMQERADEIGAELRFESSPLTGTRIEIRVPAAISEPVSDDRQAHSNPYRG